MAIQIKVRRGTASEWTSADPTLAAGEIGAETDTSKLKVGDGSTAWSSLAYTAADASAAYSSVNTQAGTTYTFSSGDATSLTSFTSSSAVTATIPPNSSVAFAVGSRIDLIQKGTGEVTIAAGAGVTVNSTALFKTRTQYSIISAIKLATDEWVLTGDLKVV